MIDRTGVDESALPLHQLIRSRMDEHGWSYADLARRSDNDLTRGRWQQLGSGVRQKKFPDPASLTLIAEALDVDITTVVLSAALALGLDVRPQRPVLAQLLPAGTERLSDQMRESILTLIRAAVADTGASRSPAGAASEVSLEWSKADAPSRRRPEGMAESSGPDAG